MSGAVLVTGGAGFIGTNLVRELVRQKRKVVVLDNEFLGRFKNLEGVACTQIKGDVLDLPLLERLVAENQVDRICHLAGYTSAPMFDDAPARRVRENFEQFLNVLETARRHPGLRIAYASTSSIYARSPKPFHEDLPIRPGTPYELSKYVMEQAAHMYNLQYGVIANGLRFFSVYGPFENHKGRFANNISQFYWSIHAGVRPIVFGDGSQTRDFTYVDDLVAGILAILEKGHGSEPYNIGTGEEHSFNEMVRIINEELGTDVQPVYKPNPLKNYVPETRADASKLRNATGWQPKTKLRDGIRNLIRFGRPMSKPEAQALYDWVS